MWRLRSQKIVLSLLLFCINGAFASGQEYLEGSITYVSSENAFIDLGRKDGAGTGDTLIVHTGNTKVEAAISHASSSSSAIIALGPETPAWKIGDHVVFLHPMEEAIEALDEPQVANVPGASQPAEVFLDSSMYEDQEKNRIATASRGPQVSGYISSRLDSRGGDDSQGAVNTASLYGQLRVRDLGLPHLDASMYMRGSEGNQASSSRAQIYSLMLAYDNPGTPMKFYAGRMYHPQFTVLGTVDGLGMVLQGQTRSLALLAGNQPNFSTLADVSRSRLGIMEEESFKWGTHQSGLILERSGSTISRNYLILRTRLTPMRGIRIRNLAEIDLDLADAREDVSLASLSRLRTSLSWRLPKQINTNLSYSYRENVVDLTDSARTEFELASRHSMTANVSWSASRYLNLSAQSSLRSDGTNKDIKVVGLTGSHRNFLGRGMRLHGGLMGMQSYLTEGGRLYASWGHELSPRLEIELFHEIYAYRILGDDTIRIRQLPEFSARLKVQHLNRLRFRTRLEMEDGKTFYRVSLSSSKQF